MRLLRLRIWAVILCLLSLKVYADTPKQPALGSWVVYWDFAKSQEAAARLGPALKGLGVFCYHLDANNRVVPAAPVLQDGGTALRVAAPRATLWLSVTNDKENGRAVTLKDPSAVHKLLHPSQRAAHIN